MIERLLELAEVPTVTRRAWKFQWKSSFGSVLGRYPNEVIEAADVILKDPREIVARKTYYACDPSPA